MKNKMTKFIFAVLFLAGLSLLLYPLFSNEWNNYRQSQLISGYDEAVAVQTSEGKIDYAGEMAQAQAYNEALKPYVLPDSFAAAAMQEEPDGEYMACLNLTGDGMMGYVEIPKINIKIPIFHTTEEEVLQTAAGHLEGSSLPVGGEGTHTVISAHRGLPSAALFTDLDRLEEGDYFFLYILDEVLCYQVDRITVARPEDTTGLAAEDDRDLATLLTCTPYGVNSHRLLVRGHRVEYENIEDVMVAAAGYSGPSVHTNYLLWVIVGLSVTGAFILGFFLYDKRQKANATAGNDVTGTQTEKDFPTRGAGFSDFPTGDSDSLVSDQMQSSLTWRDDWPEGDPEGWNDAVLEDKTDMGNDEAPEQKTDGLNNSIRETKNDSPDQVPGKDGREGPGGAPAGGEQ